MIENVKLFVFIGMNDCIDIKCLIFFKPISINRNKFVGKTLFNRYIFKSEAIFA